MIEKISRVKEAKFYIEADLEWLNRKIEDERAKRFQEWVNGLDFGAPGNLKVDIAAYKAAMSPYFAPLLALRDKLQGELENIEITINETGVPTTEEVQKYLPAIEETKS